jgi:hypothetical protein
MEIPLVAASEQGLARDRIPLTLADLGPVVLGLNSRPGDLQPMG